MFLLSLLVTVLLSVTAALRYDPQHEGLNLNENKTAIDPLDYWGAWKDHKYMPSPTNWRFPFYTLFLDRFVNGDPSNDNANGTVFEHDPKSNQLRYGGDMRGLRESLDYLQGMGIRVRDTLNVQCCWIMLTLPLPGSLSRRESSYQYALGRRWL